MNRLAVCGSRKKRAPKPEFGPSVRRTTMTSPVTILPDGSWGSLKLISRRAPTGEARSLP